MGDVGGTRREGHAVLARFDGEFLDALSQLDELHHADIAHGLRLVPGESERSLRRAVVGGPISVFVTIRHVGRRIVHGLSGLTGCRSLHLCRKGEVVFEACVHQRTEFLHALHGGSRQGAALVGRQVEDKRGVASHGFEIHLEQRFGTLHAFAFVPEPSEVGTLSIAFAGMPLPSVLIAILAIAHGPVGFTGPSGLVADPACLAAHAPKDDVGTGVVDGVTQVGNVVVSLCVVNGAQGVGSAVVAPVVAARGTIEPHFELFGSVSGQLSTLLEKNLLGVVVSIVAVGILFAPIGTVEVPGRHVKTVFHAQLLSSLCKVAGDVGVFAIRRAGISHMMVGGLGGPEAEAVVVLGGDDDALHAGVVERLGPLLAVEACRVECLRVGVAISPLTVVECVQSEVDEGVSLHLLPVYLLLLGQRQHWLGGFHVFLCRRVHTEHGSTRQHGQ